MNLPSEVLSADGTLRGRVTGGTRKCRLEGCNGIRIHVTWEDGRRTIPCSKGMVGADEEGATWKIVKPQLTMDLSTPPEPVDVVMAYRTETRVPHEGGLTEFTVELSNSNKMKVQARDAEDAMQKANQLLGNE